MPESIHTRRVLICEDDPAMIRIFQFLLRQQGIVNVSQTTHGKDVCPLAKREKPDLILLDMMLPDKDGLSVLAELKGGEETQKIPVIVVSGKESQNQVHDAMMAGAIDYVVKPFDPAEMGARIRNFLESMESDELSSPALDSSLDQDPGPGGVR